MFCQCWLPPDPSCAHWIHEDPLGQGKSVQGWNGVAEWGGEGRRVGLAVHTESQPPSWA